MKLAHNTTSQM